MLAMTTQKPRRLKTVERVCEIIDCLRRRGEMGVTELASEFDLSKGSVHTYLATLAEAGYISKRGGQYRLELELLTLGEAVRTRDLLFQVGVPVVTELADDSGYWAHLVREHNGRQVGLYDARGRALNAETSHRFLREGPRQIYSSAVGKSIIAFADPERRERLLNQTEWGESGGTELPARDEYLEELEKIRDRGVAFNDQEEIRGIRAVGAPIFYKETVVGAISVSGLRKRLQGERYRVELPDRVLQASAVIEVALENSDQEI